MIRTVPLTFLTEGADLKHVVTDFDFHTFLGGSLTFYSCICYIFQRNEVTICTSLCGNVMFVSAGVFQWSKII